MKKTVKLVLLALLTTAVPVTAQAFSPDELMAGRARVYGIEFHLATANANQRDLCVERRWLSGFTFERPSPAKPVEPTVYRVWPHSAAERHGLQAGDRITHVNGVHLGYGKMGHDSFMRLANDGSTLSVARGNRTLATMMPRQPACGPPVHFVDSADWTAATNGSIVLISAGAAAALTDDELAAVIGHEYAHVALRHVKKKQNRALVGALIGAVVGGAVQAETGAFVAGDFAELGATIGAISYSKKMERQADCRGVYYAARAGYDVSAAPALWERIAGTERDHQKRGGSHPSPVERAFRTRLAVDDVAMQLAGGTHHQHIQVPACEEPRLKEGEREAMYAEHRARSAARIAAHPQTLAATPTPRNARIRTISDVADLVPTAPDIRQEFRDQHGRYPTVTELRELRSLLARNGAADTRTMTRSTALAGGEVGAELFGHQDANGYTMTGVALATQRHQADADTQRNASSVEPVATEMVEDVPPIAPALPVVEPVVTVSGTYSTIDQIDQIDQDAFENARWDFRQTNGRWPNAEEEAAILVQLQQRATYELEVKDQLEELRREWRQQNGAWPTEAETETLRDLARSLVHM